MIFGMLLFFNGDCWYRDGIVHPKLETNKNIGCNCDPDWNANSNTDTEVHPHANCIWSLIGAVSDFESNHQSMG